jgi:hypothetical protein
MPLSMKATNGKCEHRSFCRGRLGIGSGGLLGLRGLSLGRGRGWGGSLNLGLCGRLFCFASILCVTFFISLVLSLVTYLL